MSIQRGWPSQRIIATLLLLLGIGIYVPHAFAQDAATLLARHEVLKPQLANNPFHRPFVLESEHTDQGLKGEVHAVHAQPFGVIRAALLESEQWCDVLMLHLNVKGCFARSDGGGELLTVFVGRKFDQPLSEANRVDFDYRVLTSNAGYLQISLEAAAGPLGTSDYRIVLEVAPLDARRSLAHMSFSYAYGMRANLAMKGYLATVGRSKVGFSVVSRNADGTPVLIGDERGVVERNTMRYYLALESYLDALGLPDREQPERRIRNWYAAVERYPKQLHDMEREAYLDMKRGELARQDQGATRFN